MLTIDDEPTLRNMLMKRLHEEGKTEIADIQIRNVVATTENPLPAGEVPHIQVGIWFVLKDRIGMEGLVDPRSFFDLPPEFDRQHVLNEIDEIAEQLKFIRSQTKVAALVFQPGAVQPRKIVVGTGLRGRWPDKTAERSLS